MLVKLVQPENAKSPMPVTPLPILILVKLVQPENARAPMLVTLSGIVILIRLVQPENAQSPMLVTLPSAGMTLVLQPAIKVVVAVSIRQFPAEWYFVFFSSTEMLARLPQLENAASPMLVTLFGIVMLVRLAQPKNAYSPMLVTLLGMVILVRLVHL